MNKIPVSMPFLGEEEKQLVIEAVSAGEISGTFGKFLPKFENEFSQYVECKYGIVTSNGTTALHLALATLGISVGDEVLVAAFTNMATFFTVHYQSAIPIPIDIEFDTWNINPSLLEEKITKYTKAIIVVHIYGHPADMDQVLEIAKKHNLFVIEDAAEAHGALYRGKKVGSLGDIGCFSFYANKIITTGEGGMIVTNNNNLAERARSLGSLAYGGKDNRFRHIDVGFNYRLSNIQAALGCAQLQKIEQIISLKRDIANFYNDNFLNIPELQLPVEKSYAKNVYWMYHLVLRGKAENKRKLIMLELKERGIETREAFVPYNLQPKEITKGLVEEDICPVANYVSKNGFYLPSGPILKKEQLQYVVNSLKQIIKKL
ncbi:MAG: DegT/DnrJ/EryC1/StrS family aminotransferase [Patescibacteria group bacterium]